jgi:hypothetical protein
MPRAPGLHVSALSPVEFDCLNPILIHFLRELNDQTTKFPTVNSVLDWMKLHWITVPIDKALEVQVSEENNLEVRGGKDSVAPAYLPFPHLMNLLYCLRA